ncbi:MAG TPA: cytidylate kinase family protein [Pseudonocardiaceae bacterium]|jgi:uridine kinase
MGTRAELLECLADAVGSVEPGHPTRVAIDGPPAAGKTTLAAELAELLRARGREVVQATIEEFLTPRSVRYRRGEESAEGCYQDSFDFDALHRVLLDPLGPGGDHRFQAAVYDKIADIALSPPVTTATADAVLVFDGVFLMRPELIDAWDLRVFISIAFEEGLDRARIRDRSASKSSADVERKYRGRYIPSQRFYFETVHPTDLADIVVHNDQPQSPVWETRTRIGATMTP